MRKNPKITINQIKKLREQIRAPVMECKRALEECQGDFKKAKSWLRKKGLVRVEKKKDREAKQGLIHCYTHSDGKIGAMIKICCESDFVAKNREFEKLSHELCLQVAAMKPKNVKALLCQEYIRDPKKTIKDLLNEAIAKFGENIKIEEFTRLEV